MSETLRERFVRWWQTEMRLPIGHYNSCEKAFQAGAESSMPTDEQFEKMAEIIYGLKWILPTAPISGPELKQIFTEATKG